MRPYRSSTLAAVAGLLALQGFAHAKEPEPEIARPTGTPQAIGAVHTVRGIPEACTRLEGVFTGEAAQPYRMAVVRTSPQCQARARFLEFTQARPSGRNGWIFNDRIRIPSATCATQMAVVRVWRKPGGAAPPKLDAQGRSRIYLQDAAEQARRPSTADLPAYTAEMHVEGKPCS